MAITLYGIPNCDTVKKARSWLDTNDVEYVFHDFKKAGISSALVKGWLKDVEWDALINRKGTTWRALPDERKAGVVDEKSAVALMLEAPSVIKRPVLAVAGITYVGFSGELYESIFGK